MIKFDEADYRKNLNAQIDAIADGKKIADEISKEGFSNIFFVAVGGTVAMMMHFGEIAKQYTKIPVYVEHAAEIVLTGHSQLNKDSIVIMGSKSDLGVMEGCTAELEALDVPYELVIASAHRTPAKVHEWASTAADRGIKVIIAAAGKAAHLGGVVAAFTPLPVIGVPMKTSDLGGMDSLLSMVQMPSGVPVACVAINGAKNAAIYATQILGACDPEYRKVIEKMKQEMADA